MRKRRLLSILLAVVMVMGIMPAFGVMVMAEDSLPTVTSVTLTGEGITYDAEHRLYIIPTDMTEDVTVTISGTNFANLNENCFFEYGGAVNSPVTTNYGWTIDTVNNTATKSVGANYLTNSSARNGFEFKFSTNGGSYYDLKGIGYWAICADENPYAGAEEITIPDSLPEITNEIARAFENGSAQASYSEGDGWSGVYWSDKNIYAHFAVNLAAGDVVYYELSDFVTNVGLADTKQDEWPQSYDYIALPKKGFIEVEKDGEYVFFTDHDVKVKAYCEIHGMISHEPTSEEPYVEVNLPEGAMYQWYKVTIGETEVVDDGEIGDNAATSYYEEGVGWQGSWWGDDGAYYFWVYLYEGDTITITPSAYCDEIGIWDEYDEYGECFYEVEAGGEVTYTAKTEDWYYVYAYTDINDDTTLRAYTEGKVYDPIEGETAARLVTAAPGEYRCEVTFADGSTDTSDSFVISMFTHQPTQEEPYVEVVNPEGATYQWYKVEGDKIEVVEDGETGESYYDSYYEEGVGWHGSWWDDDGADYFWVYLYEGDTITITPSAYCDEIGIWDDENNEYAKYFYYVGTGSEVSYTAAAEGWYDVYAYTDYADETTLRAYIGEETHTTIEGETTARLSRLSKGEYYCLVTLADGTAEKSDSFEINNIYVTIDGVETAVDDFVELGTKNEDGTYSLPENTVGYYIDDTFVDAGKYAVEGGEVITTVYFNVAMLNGAQVRYGGGLDENGKISTGNGLRFLAIVDRSEFDAIGYGMKITAEGSDKEVLIDAIKWQDDSTYSVAITDMAVSNYNRNFTATPYVVVKYDDGSEKVVYGSESVTRSIYYVASGLLKTGGSDQTVGNSYGLQDVLNAYVNMVGVRLNLYASGTVTASDKYTGDVFFDVASVDNGNNSYTITVTPITEGFEYPVEIMSYWDEFARINNNNSIVKTCISDVIHNEDGGVTFTFTLPNGN